MSLGPFQLLIIALVILVLFGRGRISEMMGDFGKGVKSFRQGINEDDRPPVAPPAQIEGPPPVTPVSSAAPVSSATPVSSVPVAPMPVGEAPVEVQTTPDKTVG